MTRVSHKTRVWTALWTVYIVWGSTYLGIELAGETIPGVFGAELRIKVIGAMGHIEMDEIGGGDQPRHSRAIIEAVRSPQRRHHIAEVDAGQAAAHAQSIDAVAIRTCVGVDRAAARGIGGASKLRHLARASLAVQFRDIGGDAGPGGVRHRQD